MKRKIIEQDLRTVKSNQKLYKIEYRDSNDETIYTINVGLSTFEVAEEFGAKNCPQDRFIETWEVVPV